MTKIQNDMDSVEELRRRLKSILSDTSIDTSTYLRFLKARNYDINAAETMLRKHIHWRATHNVDTIVSWYIPDKVCENYILLKPVCFDKEGSPVIYLHFGNVDLRGVVSSLKLQELFYFIIWRLENDIKTIEAQSKKLKKKVEKWNYILDFENLSLATVTNKLCVEFVAKVFSLYEANYPEMLKSALLTNTTMIFQLGFALIKPLLTGPTLQKIKVFGKEGWKEELLKNVHADELPAFLGGNKTNSDIDVSYRDLITARSVPKSYYLINQKAAFLAKPEVRKITVNRCSKERIEVNVLQPSSVVEWEFQTKEKDIVFSFLYEDGSDLKEFISKHKCDPSLHSEVGFFKCRNPGTYFLEFDNTYSWLHQKEVYYKFNIIENNEDNSKN